MPLVKKIRSCEVQILAHASMTCRHVNKLMAVQRRTNVFAPRWSRTFTRLDDAVIAAVKGG
jgi:hypothetical protein